jgi:hypothetical protein
MVEVAKASMYRCALIALLAGAGVARGQNVVTWHGSESCCAVGVASWAAVPPPPFNFVKVAVANNLAAVDYMVGIDCDGFLIKWECSGEYTQSTILYSHVGGGESYHTALQAGTGVVQPFGEGAIHADPHINIPDSRWSLSDLSVGEYHSVGVVRKAPEEFGLDEGDLVVWGTFQQAGQVPYWSHTQFAHPRFNLPEPYNIRPIQKLRWKVIVAGAYNSAGILDYPDVPEIDGRLIVWGSDRAIDGGLVTGFPVDINLKYKAVALGHRTLIAIQTGNPAVEGLLTVFSSSAANPELVAGKPAGRFISVSGGYQTLCAVSIYGQMYCWGSAGCGGPITSPSGNNFLTLAPAHSSHGQLAIVQGAPCYANCDRSTTPPLLTANDFICFANAYTANDPYADCDGVGGLTANDYTCFSAKYTLGCGQ